MDCIDCKDMSNYEPFDEEEIIECDNCINQTFSISPKGLAICALESSGITDAGDERINAFWTIFELLMEKHGYVRKEE